MEEFEQRTWKLSVDGSLGDIGFGAGIIMMSWEGHKLNFTLRFAFKAINNMVVYEVLGGPTAGKRNAGLKF